MCRTPLWMAALCTWQQAQVLQEAGAGPDSDRGTHATCRQTAISGQLRMRSTLLQPAHLHQYRIRFGGTLMHTTCTHCCSPAPICPY